ncbi:hypothetical protein C6A87_006990 [Mycobacterium sp. ITM-2016-00317]|uniref:hypothetical protein n=1 Tax=Mycobacterium sp. ITM-2016-00317 TaxID=2099694 RepID=UPI00287FD6F0|nr:hypothetical protein [Mycobacterium sp. ITM-2016-00317]WNG88945.1 hypothetical protein C6A87_006990 [Mycobacterium sp. ITM-2016-00317]
MPVIAAGLTLGATLGVSAPAGAANEAVAQAPAPTASAPLIMPEVRTMVLQRAVRTLHAATSNAELDLRFVNRKDVREVINQQNWEVCAQSPSAGRAISQKTMRVILYVKRPGSRGCS